MAMTANSSFVSPALNDRISAFRARWNNRRQRRIAQMTSEFELGVVTASDLGLGRRVSGPSVHEGATQ